MQIIACSHVIRPISHARLSAAQVRQAAARRRGKGSMRGRAPTPRVSLPEACRAAATVRAQIQDPGLQGLTQWLRA